MNKLSLPFFLVFLLLNTYVFSQDKKNESSQTSSKVEQKSNSADFEGVIVYEIAFPGMQIDERAKALMPKEMKLFIKGKKQRLEMQQTVNVKSVTITDSETQTSTVLMDMMDKKMAMKVTKEDVEKELAKTKMPKIVYSDETKTIAGFKCKKAELVYEDGKKSVIYYTEDVKISNFSVDFNNPFPQIKGFPLEFELDQKGTIMRMTATRVSKEMVPITLFMVPEGYQEITREQLKGAFGGSK